MAEMDNEQAGKAKNKKKAKTHRRTKGSVEGKGGKLQPRGTLRLPEPAGQDAAALG